MQELKEYWDEAYSSSSKRVAYVSAEGEEVTELHGRASRNQYLFHDFITHCQHRPAPAMNKLFATSKSCIEIGCGTGEFLVGLMSITGINEGIGMDLSGAAISHAKESFPPNAFLDQGIDKSITWYAGDMMDISMPTPADLLIANQVVEHFRDPKPILEKMQELAQYIVVLTPYKERIPEWGDDILDGSDNHLISVDESTYVDLGFEVLEDLVFFSKEGWGVSREGECPLQYAVLIKGTTPSASWGKFK